jgi:histidyl-tRNA synthetase
VSERPQVPRGTYDVLPAQAPARLALEQSVRRVLEDAGFGRIETPIFEHTDLFARGVGASTDIVQKEMYTFQDAGGRSLTLRPEGTAPIMRAYHEHGMHKLPQPAKLWYWGSFFRYERAQAGRYRQFWQVGAESIGSEDPSVDAESIALLHALLTDAGVRDVRLLLGSLGTPATRAAYREQLVAHLRAHEDRLSQEVRDRIDLNPLRAFDADHPGTREVMAGAPQLMDQLDPEDAEHFAEVRARLDAAGIAYELDPTLVRGLDYYTRTVFEFTSGALGAQSAVGGGGRYDGLSEMIGGPELPSVGWALGVDRTVLALEAEGVQLELPATTSVFAVPLGEEARRLLFGVVTELRRAGVATDFAFGGRGLKGAMKSANRSGARFTIVAGERDLADGAVQLKDMESGEQSAVPLDGIVEVIQSKLG